MSKTAMSTIKLLSQRLFLRLPIDHDNRLTNNLYLCQVNLYTILYSSLDASIIYDALRIYRIALLSLQRHHSLSLSLSPIPTS